MKISGLVLLFFGVLSASAQQKRALLIGIDQYAVPSGQMIAPESGRVYFPNLRGCKNDAASIQELLMSRYHFPEGNCRLLLDSVASRAHILAAFDTLLQSLSNGDIGFIYYAGHGSQVTNSLSAEYDHQDETIVPADTWKIGVKDITDKQLAAVFNRFIDKGIKLTVIIDCCHSGTISRSPIFANTSSRYMPGGHYDTRDSSRPQRAELRPGSDFLLFSACQDDEIASEITDENSITHGVFTSALLQALNQEPVDISAGHLLTSVRALIHANGKSQEPVLTASSGRQFKTLFGIDRGTLAEQLMLPVTQIAGTKVGLQGGFAEGLVKGNQLLYLPGKSVSRNDSVIVTIDSVVSFNKSLGTVIRGNGASLHRGNLMQVINWIGKGGPSITIYIPPAVTDDTFTRLLQVNTEMKTLLKHKWLNRLDEVNPELSIFFKDAACFSNQQGKGISEVKDISVAALTKLTGNQTLFFNLPPQQALVSTLSERLMRNSNVSLTADPNQAQYILYGTLSQNGIPAYGLLKADPSAADSLGTMPVQTDYFTLDHQDQGSVELVADSLEQYAMRLSKIRGWMQLSGPKLNHAFPFHLQWTDSATGKVIDPAAARIGDGVTLNLEADAGYRAGSTATKFVYVFIIDHHGQMTPLYPGEGEGNGENKFPRPGTSTAPYRLTAGTIEEPVGTDMYFLLATDEPIQGFQVLFNQQGVKGVQTREINNQFAGLLNMGNENHTRGFIKTGYTWSIRKFFFKTTH